MSKSESGELSANSAECDNRTEYQRGNPGPQKEEIWSFITGEAVIDEELRHRYEDEGWDETDNKSGDRAIE